MKPSSQTSDLQAIRATAAVALSIALQQMFPKAIVLSCRGTDIGFACECIFTETIDETVLALVERQMTGLIQQELAIISSEMLLANIQEYFRYHKQPIRASLVGEEDGLVEIARVGEYLEVCPAPHAASMKAIRAFKLLSVETDERELADGRSHPVTIIQGAAFGNRQELKRFIKIADAAVERDHRRLGRELELFEDHEPTGTHLWQPKGNRIRETLIDWWRKELRQQGFEFIHTTPLVPTDWLKKFVPAEGLYDQDEQMLPPSRIPLHAALFDAHLHSYRQLPLRYAECATVQQPVRRSHQWGLFSNSVFTSDEATLFCKPDQVLDALISSLQLINKTITLFGFRSRVCLYGRGSSYAGTLTLWDKALSWFHEALSTVGMQPEIDKEMTCFSGPRVQVNIADALEREWEGPFVGFDFALPERCGLRYQAKNDIMTAPVLIVQSLFRSMERFVGLLLERFNGELPVWLAPEQVRVLPVHENDNAYAQVVMQKCLAAGLRASIDDRNETLGAKVFAGETAKVPYLAIVGQKERQQDSVTIRTGHHQQSNKRLAVDVFVSEACSEVEQRRLPPKVNG